MNETMTRAEMDELDAWYRSQDDARAEAEYEAWIEERSREHEQYLASVERGDIDPDDCCWAM